MPMTTEAPFTRQTCHCLGDTQQADGDESYAGHTVCVSICDGIMRTIQDQQKVIMCCAQYCCFAPSPFEVSVTKAILAITEPVMILAVAKGCCPVCLIVAMIKTDARLFPAFCVIVVGFLLMD